MGVKRSLSHRQKGVQVYDTQIMICDKRQCSWLRGLATSPYHKRPGFVTVPTGQSYGCQRRILCLFGSSVSASYAGLQSRWLNHVFAFAAHRFLRSERSGCGSQISPFIPAATR